MENQITKNNQGNKPKKEPKKEEGERQRRE
jgi:hypothetical protein